ncbi:hypothetical protein BRARA_E01578 [Brassica rapa]|uniref:Phospholipase/carboxylesterase/thioesterase domain-containing protein n=1 Tax=Brassica campestris TaxID=3711 RepID=A0A397ZGJ4_BRACM|nr:hypothetical protein BRARA_E01578 [Brassica rapa]
MSSNSIGTEDGYVLEPQGEHRVTIVWLHDVHENSYKVQRGYDYRYYAQDCRDELDSAAVRVANILSTEPENVIKGVGGVGQGAQVALNFAKWNAVGDHTMNMRLVIGINSWFEPSIPLYFAKETAVSLIDDGFGEVSFVQFRMLGREITVNVLKKVEVWLNGKLPLDPN